jgi:hypothetical protein
MRSPLTFPHRADDHASRDSGHYRYLLPRAETSLPADVKVALQRAWEREEQVLAKVQLAAMLENVRLAAELQRPICQDTGLPLFFLQLSRCEVFTLNELETTTASVHDRQGDCSKKGEVVYRDKSPRSRRR